MATTTDMTKLLDALEKVSDRINGLDADRDEKIREARRAGATWEQIGEAMGVSKQAAWERYRRIEPAES